MEHANESKQVIVFRRDLLSSGRVSNGKIAAQVAHAAMLFIAERIRLGQSLTALELAWLFGPMTKIVVGCNDLAEMLNLRDAARSHGLQAFIVTDEGRTAFDGILTQTALAIGPAGRDALDDVTGHLKTLR